MDSFQAPDLEIVARWLLKALFSMENQRKTDEFVIECLRARLSAMKISEKYNDSNKSVEDREGEVNVEITTVDVSSSTLSGSSEGQKSWDEDSLDSPMDNPPGRTGLCPNTLSE